MKDFDFSTLATKLRFWSIFPDRRSKNKLPTYNNFEISLVLFMPNITTNQAITYTNALVVRGCVL